MKTILVASDLSERCDRAVNRALSLGETHRAKVIVASVIDEALPQDMAETMAAQSAEKLKAQIKARRTLARTEIKVQIGDPLADLHDLASEVHADLVVLGLHRPRPMLDLFRETTMERLVRMSERPVLIVRDLATGPYQKIVCPVDFSPASEAALKAAAELAPKAAMTVFHAYHVPFKGSRAGGISAEEIKSFVSDVEAEQARWRESVDLPKSIPPIELIRGSVQQVLDMKILEAKPDLIAIGAHGRASIAPGIVGDVTRALKRNPPCDILIARRPHI